MRITPSSTGGAPRGRGSHGPRPVPVAEINIVPLVDVILVLLIIFMATTAFVKDTGIKMKLPPATTGQTAHESARDVTIALGRNGLLTLDGEAVDEKTLGTRLRARVAQNPATHIVIKGDEHIEYARVVRVMDLARAAGLTSVALGTRLAEGSTTP